MVDVKSCINCDNFQASLGYNCNGYCTLYEMDKKSYDVCEEYLTDLHKPGAKDDGVKPRTDLVLGGFSRALLEVSQVGTFGANKYTDNGWMEVPN